MSCSTPMRRGFTLLEVMIVIGIAALILAISVPFVQRTFKRDAVYRAVKVIEEGLHNARATAIFNNSSAEFVIRPQDGAVQVRAGAGSSPFSRRSDPASTPGAGTDADADADPEGSRDASLGASRRDYARHAPKPYAGVLGDDVTIELLDVNFQEYRDEEEATVRFHPNGTSDEFTIVMKIGAAAWRKISLDLVTGIPRLEIIR